MTILECLMAMVITVVGVLAVAVLIADALRLQFYANDSTSASALARAKMEELRLASPTAVGSPRGLGGSLTANIADHFDQPNASFTRRWLVEAGPAGTQKITLVVVPTQGGSSMPQMRLEVLL